MFVIYDVIFFVFALIYFPYLLLRGKWHKGFIMRFGQFSKNVEDNLAKRMNIWIHAVSVGEVLAVSGIIEKLTRSYPGYNIVCSTVTKTGYELAQSKIGNLATVIFAPLDFSWIVCKYIRMIEPKIYISTETEIWPNLYSALNKNGIPIILVNGRISDKAFRGYKWVSFLTKPILKCVKTFCMQTEQDADRIAQLGAAKKNIHIVGNLKFDAVSQNNNLKLEDLGYQKSSELLIAGSTHAGEEKIIIEIYKKLKMEFHDFRLILCPRHVERVNEVFKLIEGSGFKAKKFSEINKKQIDGETIIVVDTIGQLSSLYNLAKVVFIGKTLAVGGGQNMIEPALCGKPTFVGPMTQNFKDVVSLLLREGAIIQVDNSEQLYLQIKDLMNSPEKRRSVSLAAQETVKKYRGATARTLEVIASYLTS